MAALLAGADEGALVVIDRYAVVGVDARSGGVRWGWQDANLPYIVQMSAHRVDFAQYGVSCDWED